MVIKRFTDEEIQAANQIPILDYVRIRGYPVVEYVKGYYKLHGYGGLLINPLKNCWSWESQRTADKRIGGGPIQLVMELEKKTWLQAVKELLLFREEHATEIMEMKYLNQSISEQKPRLVKEQLKSQDKSIFRLPVENETYEHIFAYLIKVRKLDQRLVQRMVKEKKLYEDKHNNCVFVGYDEQHVARFASLRGSNSRFPYRGNPAGADKQYPFCVEGTSNRLYVFEAPIDLLSFMTLLIKEDKNPYKDHYVSLAGYSMIGLEGYLSRHEITEIYVGTDADEQGKKAFSNIYYAYADKYRVIRQSPAPHKDFNDYLVRKCFHESLQELGLEKD